jgi:hypothetical protein
VGTAKLEFREVVDNHGKGRLSRGDFEFDLLYHDASIFDSTFEDLAKINIITLAI